jgi:hypothetical protein
VQRGIHSSRRRSNFPDVTGEKHIVTGFFTNSDSVIVVKIGSDTEREKRSGMRININFNPLK